MGFPLALRSMTLNRCKFEFSKFGRHAR